MTGLDAIMGSALWYALCLASVALVIGQLTVLIRAIRDGRDRRALLPARPAPPRGGGGRQYARTEPPGLFPHAGAPGQD